MKCVLIRFVCASEDHITSNQIIQRTYIRIDLQVTFGRVIAKCKGSRFYGIQCN